MRVTVKIYGALQTDLSAERLEIEAPAGSSVQAVLEALAAKFYLNGTSGVWDAQAKKFRFPVIVMIANADVEDYSQPLEDQQELVLVAPMSGG